MIANLLVKSIMIKSNSEPVIENQIEKEKKGIGQFLVLGGWLINVTF